MFGIVNWWKIATGGAAVLSAILSVLLGIVYMQNRDLTHQRSELSKSIYDPVDGYVTRLAQANTNVETLKAVISEQNVAYENLSRASEAKLRAAEAQLAKIQSENKAIEKKLQGFLTTKPQGATLEERIQDIDRRAMLELLP